MSIDPSRAARSETTASRAWVPGAVLLIVALAMARVIATYPVFSQTTDEAVHILAGYDWWKGNLTRMDPEHPPLARILFGLPFVLQDGVPDPADDPWPGLGNSLLWSNGNYIRDLSLARAGNLLFLVALLLVVFFWTRRLSNDRTAILATAIVSALPPVLAHAGLATTDLAATATITGAAYAFHSWYRAPNVGRALVLGVAAGLGLAAKFSFVLFFPAAALVIVLIERRPPLRRAITLTLSLCCAMLVVAAVYRFSLAPLVNGWSMFRTHAENGHAWGAFLWGEIRTRGWWYYFPVAVFYKTPLALLIAFGVGTYAAFAHHRHLRVAPLIAFAMLVCSLPVSVNIGVRHVLPLYAPMSMTAAGGLLWLWSARQKLVVATAGALLFWYAAVTSLTHPDYLSYFNEAAGTEPWRILVDSNYDWGQDTLRLAEFCRAKGIDEVYVRVVGGSDIRRFGFGHPHWFEFGDQPHGWVAIGEHPYQMNRDSPVGFWLRPYPYIRIGTVRLYRVP